MEPVLPTFLAAFLAEWGDPTQLLTIALVSRFPGDRRVSIGIAAAALANGLLSAYFGTLVAGYVNFRALTLLIALALLFAGFGMMLPVKPPKLATYGSNSALVVSFLLSDMARSFLSALEEGLRWPRRAPHSLCIL